MSSLFSSFVLFWLVNVVLLSFWLVGGMMHWLTNSKNVPKPKIMFHANIFILVKSSRQKNGFKIPCGFFKISKVDSLLPWQKCFLHLRIYFETFEVLGFMRCLKPKEIICWGKSEYDCDYSKFRLLDSCSFKQPGFLGYSRRHLRKYT